MSDIVLRNIAPPKDDDILSVDIYSDGKARCYSWSDKWIDAEVIDSKPVTNADRIRAMTDEELAIWLSAIMDCSKCVCEIPCAKEITTKFCKDVLRDWLKAPASTEGER